MYSSPNPYNLSISFSHHSNILRSVACNQNGLIVTGAFDKMCSFIQTNPDNTYSFIKNTNYHDDYIYTVYPEISNRGFFSGSKDKRIILMDNQGNPLGEFLGHDGTVNSLSQHSSIPNWLISGSWDTTAKVWDVEKQTTLFTLSNHAYAVSVLALPNKHFVTGSQDKTLRFWNQDKEIISIPNAHDDIIRSIILSPSNDSIFTCSNDCYIKQWSFNGQLLNTFLAHEGFIFSLCSNNHNTFENMLLFSSSDDRSVKVWKSNGGFIQSIPHPNTVWDSTINPMNGDLLTACADNIFRVFTTDTSRSMNTKALEEYNHLCEMANVQNEDENKNDQVDINSLPSIEAMFAITNPKDGEIRLFNNNGKGEAYCYKQSERKWELLGEVMGKKESKKYWKGDRVFPAGEYDYIFDVELEDRISQLPFNEGGNALVAAEKFVGREKLHRAYVDDITKFLRANTGSKGKNKKKNNYSAKNK